MLEALLVLGASMGAGAVPARAQGGSGTALAWHWLNPLPQGNSLAGVAYGNGLYVAVGGGGTILTSSTGSTWQTVASGTQEALNGITYGGGTFVAVGAGGVILTSSDGQSWSLVAAPTSANLNGVAYGGGQFTAVGAGGAVLVSPNGVQWTAETSSTSEDLYAVAYGNGVWVATGEGGENTQTGAYITTLISSSDNGATWTSNSVSVAGADLYGLTYASRQFVAVGDAGFGSDATILTSPDGSAWTAQTSGVSGSLDAVGYAPGLAGLLAVGSSGQMLTSADGVTWRTVASGTQESMAGVACAPASCVAVGVDGTIVLGSSVFAPVSTAVTTANLVAVAFGDGTAVALGETVAPAFASSVDVPIIRGAGGVWSDETLSIPSPGQRRTVTTLVYGSAGYVGVGNETVITSTDGTSWTVARSVYDWGSITYGDGEYLAVGWDFSTGSDVIAASATGANWTITSAPFNTAGPGGTRIAFGAGLFVISAFNGNSDTDQIFTSANGNQWSAGSSFSLFSPGGIAYGNGRFVLVGNGNSLEGTPDGLTSTDGTTWTTANLPTAGIAGYTGIAYGGGEFVAVGFGGHAYLSPNGSAWTQILPVTANDLDAVTYTGAAFMAVGMGGMILQTEASALPPTISSLTPSSGPPGTPLVITGTGFGTAAGAVYFTPNGGAPVAAAVTAWSDTSVTAQVPATLGPGTVSVAVYNATDGLTSSPVLFTVTTAPLLASLTPDRGAIGSSLTLTGSGFGSAPGTVVFTEGAVIVTQTTVTSWNPTQVTVAVPSGLTPGSLQVAVRSAAGQQSNPLPFTLTGPVLQSLTPTAGAPNSTLTLAGAGFGTVAGAVYFQGSLKTAVQTVVQSWSDSQVVTTVPGVTPGTVEVAVYNPATGLSNSLPFLLGSAKSPVTVLKWQPDPIAGPGSLKPGAQVTLTVTAADKNGQGIPGAVIDLSFQGATGGGSAAVAGTTLTGTPEPFTADTSGDVTVTYTAPSTLPAAGVDEIIAQNAPSAPTATATDSYAFAPVASYSFSPSPVAATGSLTAGASTTVTLTARDSKGAPLAAAPVYLALLPTGGGGSASVSGTSLGAAPTLFNTGADGTLNITYTAPATLPQGGQDVLVAQNAATAPSVSTIDSYTFAPLLPVVTAVSPSYDSSAPNTPVPPVTITGTGFNGATAVYFGPYQAPGFQVVSDRRIIAQVPRCDAFCYQSGHAFAFDGTSVNVRVENPAGKSLRSFADLYTFDAAVGTCAFNVPCPVINAITPNAGPMEGGTPFTAAGSNLNPFPGLHVVGSYTMDVGPVNGIGGVTSYSATTLSGSTPAGCGTQYVTAGGLPQPGAAFTYTGEPVVTGISPSTAAPGSLVTIRGQSLSPVPGGDITVAFGSQDIGGLNSGGITVVSDTEIRAVVPQGGGAVYVRVQSIGTAVGIGGSAQFRCWSQPTTAGLFTYASVPVVDAVSPSSGPAAGGTAVTITGRGFAGATRVSFGGTTAASFTVVNDSEITAVAPPGSGTVDVTVTAPGGTSAASPADRFAYAGPISCTGSGSVSASGGTVGCGSLATLAVPAGATSGSIKIVLSPTALQQLAAAGNHPSASPAGQQLFQALRAAQQAGPSAVLAVDGQQVTVPSSFTPQSFAAFVGQLASALGLPSSVTEHWTAGMQAAFDIGSNQGTASDLRSLQSAMDWLTSNLGLPPSAVDPQGTLAYVENGDRDAWLFGTPPQSASPADPWYQMWQNALVNAAANGCDAGCQQAVFFGPGIDGSLSFQNTGLCQGVQCYDQAVQNDLQRMWWIENTPGNACLLSSGGCGGDPPPAGDPPQDPPTVAEGLSAVALPLALAPGLLPPLGTGLQVQLGGASLQKPATLTLSFDPSQVPPGDAVAVYSFSGGGFTALPTAVAGNLASAPITASGTYGVLPAPARAPLVLGVSPASGAAGTSVTLTGSGFTGTTAVAFGPAAAASFQVISDSEITAAVPPGAGTVAVRVTTPGGSSPQSALSAFTYGSVPSGPALSLTATPQATVTGQSVLVQATLTGAASPGGQTVQFTTTGGTLSAASTVTGADGAASTLLSDGAPETDQVTATANLGGRTLTASVDVPFVTAPAMPTVVAGAVYGDLPSIGAPIPLGGSVNGSSVDLSSAALPGLDVTLDAGSSSAAASVAGTVSATVFSTASALQLLAGTPTLAVVGTSPSAPTSATFVGPVVQFSLSGTAAQLFGEDSTTQDTGAVVVSMPYDAAAVSAGGTPEVVWLDAAGQWTNAGVVVLGWGGGLVTALLPHLSTYTVVAMQGSVATSESLTASAGGAAAGGSVTVTATVRDQSGAAMAGVPVSFATTLGSVTPTTAVTNGNGQASAALTSAQAGTATVTATVSGISPPSMVRVIFSATLSGGSYAAPAPAPPPGVGSTGGTLATSDGAFSMAVPAGAVPVGQSLQVSESAAPAAGTPSVPSGLSAASAYFTLTGPSLSQPVTASVRYESSALGGLSPLRLGVWSDGVWRYLPTSVDAAAGTVSFAVNGPGTFVVLANTTRFSDVPAGYWAQGDIDRLLAADIVNGYPGGTFQPEGAVTRAQFVKMLVLALGLVPGTGSTSFTDVPPGAWYAPYVSAAVQAGLVQGITPSTFGPDRSLTREQMAVLLARALKLTGSTALTFSDAGQIAPWAQGAVAAAVAAGYLNGLPGGSFEPLANVTRAQAAKVLAMVLSQSSTVSPTPGSSAGSGGS